MSFNNQNKRQKTKRTTSHVSPRYFSSTLKDIFFFTLKFTRRWFWRCFRARFIRVAAAWTGRDWITARRAGSYRAKQSKIMKKRNEKGKWKQMRTKLTKNNMRRQKKTKLIEKKISQKNPTKKIQKTIFEAVVFNLPVFPNDSHPRNVSQ